MHHLPSQRGANAGHYVTLAAEDDGWVRYDDDAVAWERGEPQALSSTGCALTFAIRYTLEPETV